MVIVIYINKVFQNGGQNGKKIKAELLNQKKKEIESKLLNLNANLKSKTALNSFISLHLKEDQIILYQEVKLTNLGSAANTCIITINVPIEK